MYKHILVALDGRPESEQALKQAISLAKLTGASLTGISVIEKLPVYAATVGEVAEVKDEMEKYFARVQSNAVKIAASSGISMKTITRAGKAAQTIVHYAEDSGIDLIILGAQGQRSLGSTADKVTESASCSVLIARTSLPSIRVHEIMTEDVLAIDPSTPLTQVAELLIEKGVKAVPVVEANKVVGIITGGDLLTRAGMGLRLSVQRVLPLHALSDQISQLGKQGKVARDIMTSPVITIRKDASVQAATNLMAEKQVKRLPVVDDQGNLVGIISRTDILTLVASNHVSSELFPAIGGSNPRTAGDIMFRDVPTVDPDTPMNEVLNMILATPLRRVVVTDENKRVLGIIVDTDIIKTVYQGKTNILQNLLSHLSYASTSSPQLSEKASDLMTDEVYRVKQDTPLIEAIQLMMDKRIKRLVVTDDDNRLLGMVSRDSILRVLNG